MRTARSLPATLLCVGLLACSAASTRISTLAAPELRGRRIRTVMVVANFEHIGVRRASEEEFIKHAGAGLTFIPAYSVFFPGQVFSAEQVAATLSAHGIEATLVLDPLSSGTTSQYVPPTYSTTCSAWTPQGGCAQTVTATNTPGATISKPWVTTSVTLYDARSGQPVWVASGITGGNAFANAGTLLESVVERIAGGLESDQVTDRRGCLLEDADAREAELRRHLALADSAPVFRRMQNEASRPLQYAEPSTPRGRARVDSTNAERARLAEYATERLAASPSPVEVEVIRSSIEGLYACRVRSR